MSTRKLGRTIVLAFVVTVGVVSLSGTSAFAFFGHPYVSQLTEAPEVAPVPGPFASPWSLAFDSTGDLFLADPSNSIVDVFDSSNAFKTQAGSGFLSGGYTRGVAVDDATGDIYVGDSNHSEVFVMKPDGKGGYEGLSPAWTGTNSKAGTFGGGCCYVYTAVDNSTSPSDEHKGDVYVLSTQNAVDIFKPKPSGPEEAQEGEFIGELTAPGGFAFGEKDGLTVDGATGEVYVADPGKKVVDEFSSTGAYLGALTETPAGPFGEPVGVGVEESTGNVYVVDASNKIVDEFDGTGKYVSRISETAAGPLIEPLGVAVNSSGDVYVSDKSSEPRAVDIFGPAVVLPDVTTGEVSEFKKTSAKLEGVVNPVGEEVTSCLFEYGTSTSYGQTVACSPAPGSGSSPVPISVEISGLTQETTYHYRLVAGDANGVNQGPDKTFTTASVVDSLKTKAATNVEKSSGTNTATLNGSLAPDGVDTHYYFQYGESEAYGFTSPALPGTDAGEASKLEHAQTILNGLEGATTYHFRLVGVNSSGTVYGADMTFTTPQAVEGVLTGPATEVLVTSATLNGSLEPNGFDAHYLFEYGEDQSYGSVTTREDAGELSGVKQVNPTPVTGLEPNKTYHYRLTAENTFGTTHGSDETLTTIAAQPVIHPLAAVTRTTAVLTGTVNPENSPTTYHFVYGPTTSYGQSTPETGAGSGFGEVTISGFPISELEPGTTLHYRLIATNEAGTIESSDQTLTTSSRTPPTVTTAGASGISQSTVTISGTVSTNGLQTNYGFEIGTVAGDYGPATGLGSIGGTTTQTVTMSLEELQPGTTYDYRVTATSSDGTSYGADETFTTSALPNLLAPPSVVPLIATPAIVFPNESKAPAVKKKAVKKKKKLKKRPKHTKHRKKK